MHFTLDKYYASKYGNYVTPLAFTMPDSSVILDQSSKSPRIDMKKWLRYELQEVEEWITKMPGTSEFTTKDHNLLFKSSSLLLVFLKIAERSGRLPGHLTFANDVHFRVDDFKASGITKEVLNILKFVTYWIADTKIDPVEFCLLGAVIYAFPFLPDLELQEIVHGAQEDGILNFLEYNEHNGTRFNKLCRLINNLDCARRLISVSPNLMDYLSKWDITLALADVSLTS